MFCGVAPVAINFAAKHVNNLGLAVNRQSQVMSEFNAAISLAGHY